MHDTLLLNVREMTLCQLGNQKSGSKANRQSGNALSVRSFATQRCLVADYERWLNTSLGIDELLYSVTDGERFRF